MMPGVKEYIDREALLIVLETLFHETDPCGEEQFGYLKAHRIVREAPAADVAQVVHGEWLLKHIGHGHYWECSVCHTNPCIYVTENTKFCPNCGAKMDSEVE